MSDKSNRLDMIRKLGGESSEIFESYIPSHYNEVYAMYTILQLCSIDYDDIEFYNPKISGKDSFIFVCRFKNPEDIKKLEDLIERADGKVKFTRHHEYKIVINEQLNCTNIKFKYT